MEYRYYFKVKDGAELISEHELLTAGHSVNRLQPMAG